MENDFLLIYGLTGKSTVLDFAGIFLAQYLAYILVVVFGIVLITQKNWRRRLHLAFFSAVSLIVSYGIIEHAINYFFFRPRPFVEFHLTPLVSHAADASFPSGHATIFFTLAALMFFWIDRRWGVWFFVGALLMGAARVFVGLHYPLDIIAGAAIGCLTPFLVAQIFKKYKPVAPTGGVPELEKTEV